MIKPERLADDTNVHIPSAVRRASEQANALHAEMLAAQTAAADPAPVAPTVPDITPEVTPAPVTPEVTPADINWEHRFNSMKGRYDKERLEKIEMSNQIAQLQAQMAQMQVAQQAPVTPPELRADALLSPEVVNEYGEEFLGVVGKKAKAELLPEIDGLKQQLTSLQKQLEGNNAATKTRARHDMHSQLDAQLPNWKDVNVAPEFHSWLALPDDYSGVIRHELLKAAYEQNNAPRVLAFFKGFLSNEAASDPAAIATPDQRQEGKIPLEDLAAPGRAKTAAASSTPVEKPFITHAQIAKFYSDSAAGRYRGKDEERQRIERQIFDAQREGRIR